jgi:hypothetical protein
MRRATSFANRDGPRSVEIYWHESNINDSSIRDCGLYSSSTLSSGAFSLGGSWTVTCTRIELPSGMTASSFFGTFNDCRKSLFSLKPATSRIVISIRCSAGSIDSPMKRQIVLRNLLHAALCSVQNLWFSATLQLVHDSYALFLILIPCFQMRTSYWLIHKSFVIGKF